MNGILLPILVSLLYKLDLDMYNIETTIGITYYLDISNKNPHKFT